MRVALNTPEAQPLPVRSPLSILPPKESEEPRDICITAELLIPGRGEPIKYGAVIAIEGKIAWVGKTNDIPSKYRNVDFVHVPVVMPGMWDCHVHFSGQTAGAIDSLFGASQALAGARTAADAAITLNSGFTTVREVAGFGIDVAQAINEGTIVGPNVYSTSAAISTTGGHGDVHTVPIDAVRAQQAKGVPMLGICDGVDECIKTVRLMIRRGAKVIKICATGGVGSEMDDPEDRQFSDEEIRAMVQEAARSKRIVAAHAHGKEGILAAVRNGVKTIEHGSYLDEEVAEEMKKHDAIFIATRCIVEGGVLQKEFWSPRQYAKLLALYEQGKTAYKIAVKSGVKIALGTDSCISGGKDKLMYHGTAGKELYFAVQAGMTPLQAIEACTATAPETLGPQKPASGMLKEGYDADIIAVSKNPLDDIDVLSKPSNITHVWKGGKLFKSL